jgi:hypothetical protein
VTVRPRTPKSTAPADQGVESITDLLSPYLMGLSEVMFADIDDRGLQLQVYADLFNAIRMIQVVMHEAEVNALKLIGWETGPRGGRYRATVIVPGLGTFTGNKPAFKTTWHPGTLGKALEAARAHGEINRPEDVAAVVERILYSGLMFKQKELAALGLEPKDMKDAEYGAEKLRWI